MNIAAIIAERDRLRAALRDLRDRFADHAQYDEDDAAAIQAADAAIANTSPAPVESVNKELLDTLKDTVRGDQFSDMTIILERCGHPQLAKFWRDYRARALAAIAKAEKAGG